MPLQVLAWELRNSGRTDDVTDHAAAAVHGTPATLAEIATLVEAIESVDYTDLVTALTGLATVNYALCQILHMATNVEPDQQPDSSEANPYRSLPHTEQIDRSVMLRKGSFAFLIPKIGGRDAARVCLSRFPLIRNASVASIMHDKSSAVPGVSEPEATRSSSEKLNEVQGNRVRPGSRAAEWL